ncbi:hypothetical protein EMMF5_001084 [Cystobasidiomycetes sp. EMM_F5]
MRFTPSSSNAPAAGRSSTRSVLAMTAALALSALSVTANTITCDTSLGEAVPDGAGSTKLPTVLFLSGRGARGPPSNVKSLAGYDGFGKLVSEYAYGKKDDVHTLAATKFIVIIPIAPESFSSGLDPQWWYPELVDKVVNAVAAKYPVDFNQFHCSGYSMGGMGTWRYAVHNPGRCITLNPNGAFAEQNVIKNSLGQSVTAPSDQLNLLASINKPVRAFSGSQDTTIPASWAQGTQSKMSSLGDSSSTLTILNTDHSGLTSQPFTTDLLNWMLSHSGSGSAASSPSSSGTSAVTAPSSSASSSSGSTSSSGSSSSSSTGTKKTCKRRRRRSTESPIVERDITASDVLRNILSKRAEPVQENLMGRRNLGPRAAAQVNARRHANERRTSGYNRHEKPW